MGRLLGIYSELKVLHWLKMSKMDNIYVEDPINLFALRFWVEDDILVSYMNLFMLISVRASSLQTQGILIFFPKTLF